MFCCSFRLWPNLPCLQFNSQSLSSGWFHLTSFQHPFKGRFGLFLKLTFTFLLDVSQWDTIPCSFPAWWCSSCIGTYYVPMIVLTSRCTLFKFQIQHLHLLDHDGNLLVCHQGNVGAAPIGLPFNVKYILLPTLTKMRVAKVHYRNYLTVYLKRKIQPFSE